MRINSATDLRRLLSRDALLRSFVDEFLVVPPGKLPVVAGSAVYIPEFPVVEEFDAKWLIKVSGVYDDDLRDVLVAIQALVGGAILGSTILVSVFATPELKELAARGRLAYEKDQKLDEALRLARTAQGSTTVIPGEKGDPGEPGPPGPEGPVGPPGLDGRDGRDLIATEASLGDLQDVEVQGAQYGDFLSFREGRWVPVVPPKGGRGGGYEVPPVKSVNGYKGDVVLTPADVGGITIDFSVEPQDNQILIFDATSELWVPGDTAADADGGDFGELPNPDAGDFDTGTSTSVLFYPVDGGNFDTGGTLAYGDVHFDGGEAT